MGLHWNQRRVRGGHVNTTEADVADGHLRVEETWADQLDEDGVITGSVLSLRACWLNGGAVRDPGQAERLMMEALRS